MGGRDATVNLGLSIVPPQYLAAGIFIISAFMGTATGTSMGTIGAIVPIAVGVADKGGLSLLSYSPLKVLPYLFVFVLAICGVDVFVVLTVGIFLSGVIGMATSSFTPVDFAQNI